MWLLAKVGRTEKLWCPERNNWWHGSLWSEFRFAGQMRYSCECWAWRSSSFSGQDLLQEGEVTVTQTHLFITTAISYIALTLARQLVNCSDLCSDTLPMPNLTAFELKLWNKHLFQSKSVMSAMLGVVSKLCLSTLRISIFDVVIHWNAQIK